jgi:sulfopyruvate decarboxylase alpha subunit
MDPIPESGAQWPEAIFAAFKHARVRQVGYVPDAGHSRLIALCKDAPDIADCVLTTEEEGVGLCAGAWLGGQRAALLMQSSGVGNCINTFSMLKSCGFPCLLLVTMRGEYAEFNPWQIPMGSIVEDTLKLCGFLVFRAVEPGEVADVVSSACDIAFSGNQPVAVLLSQRLIGRKVWVK